MLSGEVQLELLLTEGPRVPRVYCFGLSCCGFHVFVSARVLGCIEWFYSMYSELQCRSVVVFSFSACHVWQQKN